MKNRKETRLQKSLPPHLTRGHELYVPNDADIRKGVDPAGATLESPPYTINAESMVLSDSLSGRPFVDEIACTIFLVDKTADPRFHLEYPCRGCENWKPTELHRPRRRGALEPTDSCFGCWYTHLDGGGAAFARHDRDAAFNAWAKVKSRIDKLHFRKVNAKSEREEAKIEKTLDWANKELKRARKACHRLGFDPATPLSECRLDNQIPTPEPPREALEEIQQCFQASCSNCSAWSEDEVLTGDPDNEAKGYCWVHDGMATKGSYWCAEWKRGV